MSVDLYKLVIAAKLSKGDTPEPTGTLTITENGAYDVTQYANADVQTPQPSGSISITQNGTYDVTEYASADVNVSGGGDSVDDFVQKLCMNNLETVNIPQGTTRIAPYTFYSQAHLTSVTFPSSLSFIESSAFRECSSVQSLDIPASVISIGQDAFRDCSSLMSITLRNASNVYPYNAMLRDVPTTCAIYVPSTLVEDYKATSGWASRAAYIQAIPE